jgi:dipeptidyl aminopeptidase/acylaminoacyl peptidase
VTIAPYGSWTSPVSVEQLLSTAAGFSAVRIDGDQLYWLEARPDQGGRMSLWHRPLLGGESAELTPAPAYVRDRVHEYGGGDYAVDNGVVVYSEFSDGRLYRLDAGGSASPITPPGPLRYGDVRVRSSHSLVLAVREDHRGDGEAVNTIVALDLDGPNTDGGRVLCQGADFYATPELSADGRLAWTQWHHPNMPWNATEMMAGTFDGTSVQSVERRAGGPDESAVQPRWLGERLLVISDRTGWWNLYEATEEALEPLHRAEAEFAHPQWVLGQTPYAVIDEDHLLCTVNRGGREQVAVLTVTTGELSPMTEPDVTVNALAVGNGTAAAALGHLDRPNTLSLFDLDTGDWTEVRASAVPRLDSGAVSVAQPVTWSGTSGEVHGWFYPPTNPDFTAPAGALPPLITLSHGGPTTAATAQFQLGYQFWTSRGFAILDVDYSGSTGYGRSYRERLHGSWGIVDVEDCATGAVAMGQRGLADPERLAIKGGSAGGYTTLRALTSTDVFAAGISQYGVGDLETLAAETHKFESRYTDWLVGPYPQDRDVYRDRSPIDHLDQLSAPILLLHGLDDKVVPPNQAELMAAAARAKGLPVALILFEGEGHGFRRAETIRSATLAQLSFLGQIFGFEPADPIPRLHIENGSHTSSGAI